ncbi:transposable element Tcb1 transposase [Trichonephila clavipes]|nr:transposable element Tcb1 transposase [Trichonephila clavipes]
MFSETILLQKNYKYFPNFKKNIKDLAAEEKRNEEKVIDDFISIMDSLIKEFSARFSQFKELSETFKIIMYSDEISFDKLNLSQFDWLEIEELEMQLIDFQSSLIWIQKYIETRKKLELIEAERLTSNISKNTSNEILETWNSIPEAFNCLKKLAYAILTIFSSTYACESLFSEINSIKDSLRNRLTDDSNSACILLKKKWHVDPKRFATPALYARRSVRCVPLTATHCRLRLTWSREHALWTPQQWSCVMFSEESRFSLQSDSHRTLIWRAPGTRFHQENTIERHRYGGAGWLVWGGIILGCRTDLHVQSVTMTDHIYWDVILEQHVRLFRGTMGAEFLFMDDNARPHRANIVDECLQSKDITRMD